MKCFCLFKDKSKTINKSSSDELKKGVSKRAVSSASSMPSPRSVFELYKEKEHTLRVFRFSELREATDGFDRRLKLGEGGFGSVYKGFIKTGINVDRVAVAIKKLNRNSLQGHKQWVAEVQFLGIVDHPNLVKLLGHCSIDGERGIQRLLVYEFMPNKSLEDHLFSKIRPPLPWTTRLEIILGAAQGLAYLHEGMEVKVIYRDFKCSNVLLDNDFKPKLSDFGLAREGPTGNRSHVSTGVVGTYGYAAPEYIETGHLTLMCDVWSFGVVLYEILTGRRSLERHRPPVEQKLLDWVQLYPSDSKLFTSIIDSRLRDQYSIVAARKIAKLADSCLSKHPKERPTMGEVVERLKEAIGDSRGCSPYPSSTPSPSTARASPATASLRHPLPLPPHLK
uniref:Protein kinase domain-containing protein n=1 Tax=Kalanchoe fedtschenkoi TaxID=63787 RepID=A0A7N0UVS9_KALFE